MNKQSTTELPLQLQLEKLIEKRESLMDKGSNDEKLNDKIRLLQKQIREVSTKKQ